MGKPTKSAKDQIIIAPTVYLFFYQQNKVGQVEIWNIIITTVMFSTHIYWHWHLSHLCSFKTPWLKDQSLSRGQHCGFCSKKTILLSTTEIFNENSFGECRQKVFAPSWFPQLLDKGKHIFKLSFKIHVMMKVFNTHITHVICKSFKCTKKR